MRHCATCRCTPGPLCECGHLETSHDLPKRKTGYVRTNCTWTGAVNGRPDPCPCPAYTPREEP